MIDSRTLILTLSAGNLVLAGMLIAYGRNERLPYASRLWTVAKLCQGAAFALLLPRGLAPDLVTIPVANSVLLAGFALEAAATWDYLGLAAWRRVVPWLSVAMIGAFWAAYFAESGPRARIVLVAAEVGALFALAAAGFVVGARWSALRRIIFITDALVAAAAAARVYWGVTADEVALTTNAAIPAITFGALLIAMMINGFGFLLLTREATDLELTRLATLDPLTEALNRRAFLSQAEAALSLARRTAHPLSVLMLDLDRFKVINDRHGHSTGDAVIKALVQVCRELLRESDMLGRLGGEEFAAVLPGTALDGALRVADRIRATVHQRSVLGPGDARVPFRVSVGVAEALNHETLEAILGRADAALYTSKRNGRDRITAAAAPAIVDQGLS